MNSGLSTTCSYMYYIYYFLLPLPLSPSLSPSPLSLSPLLSCLPLSSPSPSPPQDDVRFQRLEQHEVAQKSAIIKHMKWLDKGPCAESQNNTLRWAGLGN